MWILKIITAPTVTIQQKTHLVIPCSEMIIVLVWLWGRTLLLLEDFIAVFLFDVWEAVVPCTFAKLQLHCCSLLFLNQSQSSRNCGGAFQLIPSMKRRLRSTWINKGFPQCRKLAQRRWSVPPPCFWSERLSNIKLWNCVLCSSAAHSEEEKTGCSEEETVQDPQQPPGRYPGGLFRWGSCEKVKPPGCF